jgi:hypothetical protein
MVRSASSKGVARHCRVAAELEMLECPRTVDGTENVSAVGTGAQVLREGRHE